MALSPSKRKAKADKKKWEEARAKARQDNKRLGTTLGGVGRYSQTKEEAEEALRRNAVCSFGFIEMAGMQQSGRLSWDDGISIERDLEIRREQEEKSRKEQEILYAKLKEKAKLKERK